MDVSVCSLSHLQVKFRNGENKARASASTKCATPCTPKNSQLAPLRPAWLTSVEVSDPGWSYLFAETSNIASFNSSSYRAVIQ